MDENISFSLILFFSAFLLLLFFFLYMILTKVEFFLFAIFFKMFRDAKDVRFFSVFPIYIFFSCKLRAQTMWSFFLFAFICY